MKCIKSKSGKTIDRVKDEVAMKKVSTGAWEYCSKSEWKSTRKSTVEVVSVDTTETNDVVHGLKAKDRRKHSKK